MKNTTSLLIIGIVLSSCSGDPNSLSTSQSSSLIRIAHKARASGNSDAAINFYNKALEVDATDTEALLGLADVYIDLKLLDAASEYIKKAEKAGCEKERSLYLRGKIFLLSGDDASAEKEFNKSLSIDAMNALGAIYDRRGEHKKAQSLYKAVIAKNPNYIDAYNNIGLSFVLCDQYKEAIFYLENACALKEANVTYRSNLALAYGLSGNIQKAKEIYAQDFSGNELEEKVAYLQDIISINQ